MKHFFRKKTYTIYLSLLILASISTYYFLSKTPKEKCSFKKGTIEVIAFQEKEGWGFDIYINDKLYIHQNHIPAINSNIPFNTKEDAKNIGELMKMKICENIFPPSISLSEINTLIINK